MAEMAQTPARQSYFWGPLSGLGLAVALLAGVADQVSKLWLLYGFNLEGRAPVAVAPFVDLVLTWNSGISYGLFQQRELLGAVALLALGVACARILPAHGGGTRPDHRRGARQCHRPAALVRCHGFRAFTRGNHRVLLPLVRV
jgi:hypothetical protein